MKLAVLVIAGFLAVPTNAAPDPSFTGGQDPNPAGSIDSGPRILSQKTSKLKKINESDKMAVQVRQVNKGVASTATKLQDGSNALKSGPDGPQGFGSQGFGTQGLGPQGSGPQGFGSQGFGSQGSGPQGFGSQGFGSQGSGPQGFGSQGLGPQGFGTQGFGPKPPRGPDIPFPMNLILTIMNKGGPDGFNLGEICNSIQDVDFKNYEKYFTSSGMADFQNKFNRKEFVDSAAKLIQQVSTSVTDILSNLYREVGLGRNPRFPHLIDELTNDVLWLLAPDGDWDNEIEPIEPRKPGFKPGKRSGKVSEPENRQSSGENEYESGLDGLIDLLKFIPKYHHGGAISSGPKKVKPTSKPTPGNPAGSANPGSANPGAAVKLGKPGKGAKPGFGAVKKGPGEVTTGGVKPGAVKAGPQPVKPEWDLEKFGKGGKKGPGIKLGGRGKPIPDDISLKTGNEEPDFDYTRYGYTGDSQYDGIRYGYSGEDGGKYDVPISELRPGYAEDGKYSVGSGEVKTAFVQSSNGVASTSASSVATAGNSKNSGNSARAASSASASATGSAAGSATNSAAGATAKSDATSATSSAAASATNSAAASAPGPADESAWGFDNINGYSAKKGIGGSTGFQFRFRGGKGADDRPGYGFESGREYETESGHGATTPDDSDPETNSGKKSDLKSNHEAENSGSQYSTSASSAPTATSAIRYGSNDGTAYGNEDETGSGFGAGSADEPGKGPSLRGENEALSPTTPTVADATELTPNYGAGNDGSQSISSATSAATASASPTGLGSGDNAGYESGYGVGGGTVPGSKYKTGKGSRLETGNGSAYGVGYGAGNEAQNPPIAVTTANSTSTIELGDKPGLEPNHRPNYGAKSGGPQTSASAASSSSSSTSDSENKSGGNVIQNFPDGATTAGDASLSKPGNSDGSQVSPSASSASAASASQTGPSNGAVPYGLRAGFGSGNRYGPVYGTGNGNRYGSIYGTGKGTGIENRYGLGYGIRPQSSLNPSRGDGAFAMEAGREPSLGSGYRNIPGGGIQNSASANAGPTGFGNKSGFGIGDQTMYGFGDGTGTSATFRPGLGSRFPKPGWNGYGVGNGARSYPGISRGRLPGFAQPQDIPMYSAYGANDGGTISNRASSRNLAGGPVSYSY